MQVYHKCLRLDYSPYVVMFSRWVQKVVMVDGDGTIVVDADLGKPYAVSVTKYKNRVVLYVL